MSVAPVPGLRPIQPGFTVGKVSMRQRLAAARRLASAVGGDHAAAKRMLDAAESHGIDLSHLWASFPPGGGNPRQVCLGVMSTGRTATTFTSAPESAAEEIELGSVIDAVCGDLPEVVLVQTLLEPGERGARSAFLNAGFRWVGGLAYMRRPTPKRGEYGDFLSPQWPAGVVVRHARPGDDGAIVAAMDRTYVDTLDCPELCGLRDTKDVLASHRATGTFDPMLWWIVEIDGSPEGLMLFNPCPDQASVELVYLGLSPAARGRGLGALLLKMGLAHIASRREPTITCAVDDRNAPAIRLYRAHGFTEFAHRTALVRPVRARGVDKPAASA